MKCSGCEAENAPVTFVRVGTGEVTLMGCREHLRQLIEIYRAGLDRQQSAAAGPGKDRHDQ